MLLLSGGVLGMVMGASVGVRVGVGVAVVACLSLSSAPLARKFIDSESHKTSSYTGRERNRGGKSHKWSKLPTVFCFLEYPCLHYSSVSCLP